jgi:hypothetical protein
MTMYFIHHIELLHKTCFYCTFCQQTPQFINHMRRLLRLSKQKNYHLSIIAIGVDNDQWETMRKYGDEHPKEF